WRFRVDGVSAWGVRVRADGWCDRGDALPGGGRSVTRRSRRSARTRGVAGGDPPRTGGRAVSSGAGRQRGRGRGSKPGVRVGEDRAAGGRVPRSRRWPDASLRDRRPVVGGGARARGRRAGVQVAEAAGTGRGSGGPLRKPDRSAGAWLVALAFRGQPRVPGSAG